MPIATRKLLDAVTATGAGSSVVLDAPAFHGSGTAKCTFQATVTGTGAVGATVKIQISNNNVNWLDLGTITLSGTTSSSDGFAAEAPWAFVRANCTAINGTGATITAIQGVFR